MQIKLAESAGFCFGVKRAVELCEKTSAFCGQCKTLGPIIHNGNVVDRLKEKGVFAINSVDEVETGETVIIRSHGALLQDVNALEEKGAIIVDATCPFVARIHEIVSEESAADRYIIIIGEEEHPEVKAIATRCKAYSAFSNVSELTKMMPQKR